MSSCFEITPLDTWFFRGSTPMESGMMNVVSIFPPPVSVVKGAFWTANCRENNKDFSDGLENGQIPFDVKGVYIKKQTGKGSYKIYVPAPATWYYDNDKKIPSGEKLKDISLIKAKKNDCLAKLGMTSSAGNVYYVKAEHDAKSLNGAWVDLDFLNSGKDVFGKDSVLFSGDIYSTENRTNVSLDNDKKAKDGQLFSSSHIRLREDISLIVQFNKDINLPENGKFMFGGENRVSEYKNFTFEKDIISVSEEEGDYMSIVPVAATESNLSNLISGGKIYLTSGWDLQKKNHHKPSINWIPAGAVFNKNVNNSCVLLTPNK